MCASLLRSKHMLNIHMRKHTGMKPHTCVGCQRKFSRKYQLKKHMVDQCQVLDMCWCERCGKGFLEKTEYDDHLQKTCIADLQCKTCGETFSSKIHLLSHMKSHADIFPYKCPYCPRSFPDWSSAKSHDSIHKNVQKLQCFICEKVTSCQRSFVYHWLHAHEGKKCKVCYRLFSEGKKKTTAHRIFVKDVQQNFNPDITRGQGHHFI